jgi:outer membrane protein OmpA-like peptidoglycan-associated protein
MELRNQFSRPLLLFVLLGVGIGLIWHIGHNILPRQHAVGSTVTTAGQKTARPTVPPAGSPDQTRPAQIVDSKAAPALQESVASRMAGSPAKTSSGQAKPETVAPQAARSAEKTTAVQSPLPQATRLVEPLPAALKDLENRTTKPRLLVNERGRFLTSDPILFNSGLAQLRVASMPALNKLVALLREMPDIKLEIAGYTDNIGIESANEQISAQRAAAVREYLVSQGIDSSRLESKGMGSKDPIASNQTQLGRQANRRIEFRITSPK